jgi:hypothetical protein
MAPLVSRPNRYPLRIEPPGKPLVTEGMFAHAVNNVQNRPGGISGGYRGGFPAPQIQPDSIVHGYPVHGFYFTPCHFFLQ